MRQPAGRVWAERALMVLFLASLVGTLNLIMTVHRRAASARDRAELILPPTAKAGPHEAAPTPAPRATPEPVAEPKLAAKPKAPDPPRAPSPPPEDPTKQALASIAAATAREIEEARRADRRTESLE